MRWNSQGEVENWSLLALIPLTLVTVLHGEEGRTLWGGENLPRTGKPTGRCWWLPLCCRNASKDSAGPPLGHGQMFATTARARTDQEDDHGDRAVSIVGSHQGKATNLSPLHQVWMPPLDRSLSWTPEQHWEKSRLLLNLTWDLYQTWGWTFSTSYRSQPPCKGRTIPLKDHGQKTMKTGSSGGGTELICPIGVGVRGDPRDNWFPGACPENKSLLWAPPGEDWSSWCWVWLFGTSSSQVYLTERLPTTSKPNIPLSGYQGGTVSKDFGLCTSPAVLGGKVQPAYA